MGPSTVPCGIPEVTGTDVEVSPSSTTAWVLFLRKSASQRKVSQRKVSVTATGRDTHVHHDQNLCEFYK